ASSPSGSRRDARADHRPRLRPLRRPDAAARRPARLGRRVRAGGYGGRAGGGRPPARPRAGAGRQPGGAARADVRGPARPRRRRQHRRGLREPQPRGPRPRAPRAGRRPLPRLRRPHPLGQPRQAPHEGRRPARRPPHAAVARRPLPRRRRGGRLPGLPAVRQAALRGDGEGARAVEPVRRRGGAAGGGRAAARAVRAGRARRGVRRGGRVHRRRRGARPAGGAAGAPARRRGADGHRAARAGAARGPRRALRLPRARPHRARARVRAPARRPRRPRRPRLPRLLAGRLPPESRRAAVVPRGQPAPDVRPRRHLRHPRRARRAGLRRLPRRRPRARATAAGAGRRRIAKRRRIGRGARTALQRGAVSSVVAVRETAVNRFGSGYVPPAERVYRPSVAPPRLTPSMPAGSMHPLSLRFSSPYVEAAFQTDYTRRSILLVRAALLLGFGQFALFGLLDRVMVPETFRTIQLIRAAGCALLLICIAGTFTDAFRRRMQAALVLPPLIIGAAITTMLVVGQGADGYYDYYEIGRAHV